MAVDSGEAPTESEQPLTTFRVTVEVVPLVESTSDEEEDKPLPTLSVRYTFFNGDRVESPVLSSEEWVDAEEAAHSLPGDPPEPPRVFTRDHEVRASEAAIEQLDEQPIVCFFAATAERSYECAVHCDLSAFLANEPRVVAVRDARSRYDKTNRDERGEGAAPPPTAPLVYLRVSVRLADESPPFMRAEALEKYNPLTLAVKKVQSLPGIRTSAAPLQKYIEASPHAVLRQYCRDTYCVIRPPLESLGLRRGSATDARAAARDVAFDHTVVYLTGPSVDRHKLEELLATTPFSIEVHDRDLVAEPEDDDLVGTLFAAPEVALETWERVARGELVDQVRARLGLEAEGDSGAPPELLEVDDMYTRALVASWGRAGDDHAHGRAEMRVEGILDAAPAAAAALLRRRSDAADDEVEASWTTKRPSVKCKVDVTARKRRVIPKGGVDDWRLNEAQRLATWPGAYSDAGTLVAARAALWRPLAAQEEDAQYYASGFHASQEVTRLAPPCAPFTRAAIVFPYGDTAKLLALTSAMDAVNNRTLGDSITGSLKSYQLSSEQMVATEAGDLDVLCGFMVIDADTRTVVLEGLAPSIAEVLQTVPRIAPEVPSLSSQSRTLYDSSVRFTTRLYTAFHTDLKKVRLRDPLPILARAAEIYNRTMVSADCFEALDRLLRMRTTPTLRELAFHDDGGFPLVHMILQIESKFGEPITTTDIDGREAVAAKDATNLDDLLAEEEEEEEVAHEDDDEATPKDSAVMETTILKSARTSRKAPTDSTNPDFEASLRSRTIVDYVALRRREAAAARAAADAWRQDREAERANDTVDATYVYSGQALQYTELKKAEERARLKGKKNAIFVRGQGDFLSLTVPLVDETRLRQDAELESRQRWKTQRGFVYPPPKDPEEYKAHPDKPSAARVDDLAEPWEEGGIFGADLSRVDDPTLDVDPNHAFNAKGRCPSTFGGLDAPRYERPYDSSHLGDPVRLPRGRSLAQRADDTAYYKSVHLCGEGLAAEAEEAKKREADAFRSKLVVDTLDVKVGRYCQIDRPAQTDRLNDILHDAPKARFLKKVRNATLPSGTKVPLRPPPYSIFATSEYVPATNFADNLRVYDDDIVDPSAKQSRMPWAKAIHRDILRLASARILYHKAITRIHPDEIVGDTRWLVPPHPTDDTARSSRA